MPIDTDDLFDFAALDSFRMRTVERSPERVARDAFEAARGHAAADAYASAINNGATEEAAKQAARTAAAKFTAAHAA